MSDLSPQSSSPCTLQYDSVHSVLLQTWNGDLVDELLVQGHEIGQRAIAQFKPRAIISDFSLVSSFKVSSQCIQGLAMLEPVALRDQPLILVAGAEHIYGMARMYEILNEARRAGLTAVHTLEEAYSTIELTDPQFEPIELP
ncbi:MAG TPA: hypothetical protein VMT82_04385 [candidate division Zixibacteria bacterium]|nr:hypothetical protein [candidate division Zixibacteria bacterium]